MKDKTKFTLTGLAFALSTAAVPAQAAQVEITVRNLAPANGTYFGPTWAGFHNGSFDLFDNGSPASSAVERLGEDGNSALIQADFTASGNGSTQGVIPSAGGIPQFEPGESGSLVFTVNPFAAESRYLSFASMVVPSNDAFMANGNPMMIEVFQADGTFVGGTFTIFGSQVWDAGTEVNDEAPINTAFFGQTTPNTGADENGVIAFHSGYQVPGSGGILDDPAFANADFTAAGYRVAEITISIVPEPHEYALVGGLGLLGFAAFRRRRCAR